MTETEAQTKSDVAVEAEPLQVEPSVYLLHLALGTTQFAKGKNGPVYAAEVGVYRGRSLQIFLAESAKIDLVIECIGIDTFTGLPALSAKDQELAPENAPYRLRPMFDDTTKREVEAFLEPLGMDDTYTLHEGLFAAVKKNLKSVKYSFLNLSIKTYDGHIEALNYFYKRMLPGGVLLLDDYISRRFPMAQEAINDFFED